MERLAIVEERLDRLERAGREVDEVPFYPTNMRVMAYDDTAASFMTTWETIITPRAAMLSLGLVFIGDYVSPTYTGGAWQVVVNDTTVIASGSVPASLTYTFPAVTLDLSPYRNSPDLKIQIQTKRTSGATTGGKFGGGGSIGSAARFARQL
ncbi:hypothetical protein CG747_20840 [Streptomyces sp. CB02959]|uniref:hypothetical protein n=1 Tax=Streptomyces sp. CB02959 TaxID=2020330 RepID=UPI000C277FDD|nr:hypothetical protein [Streptomyces sp. CB02959]PJN38990.1 hypothetical protein CG747_20840 [Streptomyces sp. CB02959]